MPRTINTEHLERNAMRIYGCSRNDALRLNGFVDLRKPGSKAMAYVAQRHAAKDRGIGWEITFQEWVFKWEESGVFHKRGVGALAYCMARIGDVGPYRYDNVIIKTNADNARESLEHTTWADRFNKAVRSVTSRRRDMCVRGHLLVPENRTKAGACKLCDAIRHKAYYQKKKAHRNSSVQAVAE